MFQGRKEDDERKIKKCLKNEIIFWYCLMAVMIAVRPVILLRHDNPIIKKKTNLSMAQNM